MSEDKHELFWARLCGGAFDEGRPKQDMRLEDIPGITEERIARIEAMAGKFYKLQRELEQEKLDEKREEDERHQQNYRRIAEDLDLDELKAIYERINPKREGVLCREQDQEMSEQELRSLIVDSMLNGSLDPSSLL